MTEESKRVSEEKRIFVISLIGYGIGEPKLTKLEDQIFSFESHGEGMVYIDMYMQIGKGTKIIVIPKQYLKYIGTFSRGTINRASGEMKLEIQETVELYTSKSHSEEHKWGTLELNIEVSEILNQELVFPATVGEVSGRGTGALKRAIVEGVDQIWRKVDCAEATDWGYAVNYARVGTIIGWPPEVRSWPPK